MAEPRQIDGIATQAFVVQPSNTDVIADDSNNTEGVSKVMLYVADAVDVAVVMADGGEVTFGGLAAGTFLPIYVKQVKATGTTATAGEIIAIY